MAYPLFFIIFALSITKFDKELKRIIFIFIFLIGFLQNGKSCAVCLGDFTDKEIFAYSFSVIFLISLMAFMIIFLFRKIKQTYGID